MAKPLSALGSIITVVVFLALIAVATVLYGGNQEQKVRMEQNFFWRNAKLALDYVFVGIQGVTDISLGKEYANQASSTIGAETTEKVGIFKQIGEDIKAEWENGDSAQPSPDSKITLDKIREWLNGKK